MTSEPMAADSLAQAVLQVAKKAHSEEDLRVGVERALHTTLDSLGLAASPEYEKTTLSGSADAVYGHVVIEYKRPGRLCEKGYPDKLAAQLAQYLTDLAARAGSQEKQLEALEKVVGVGLDGQQILFLRYSATGRERESPLPALPGTQVGFLNLEEHTGGFQIVGPVPVGKESIELLLLYLRSLSRKPLTAEALAAEFGPQGDIAPRLVSLFYGALEAHGDHPRVATLFDEWDRVLGIVYGEELGQASKDAPELAALYRATPSAKLKPLFFAVHTYYALLMKFLAVELASLQSGALVGCFAATLPAMTAKQLRDALVGLENGGIFATLGISNFLEGDFFGWYIDAWNDELADGIRAMARTLSGFEPATATLEPEHTRDLLKKLYEYLVPRKLRHDLGEYYTPDWLAERLLNQVGYEGDPEKRLIDPGCGSGTFLVLALGRLRQYASDHLIPPGDVLKAAIHNIVGFDLNPLSVIAARTNYLLALGDLLRFRRGPVDLPVYMCDSILTPTEQADMFGKSYRLQTVVGHFDIPGEIVAAGEMGTLSSLLESCVRDQYTPEEFLGRAARELTVIEPMTETVLEALYRNLYHLAEEGRNGLWARLLKNAFAPVLVGEFDFVVGNPPWVRWGYLSRQYKDATKPLWFEYGLFSLEGTQAQLGGGEKDLSMLFTYVSADKYLKTNARLGFVITQVVFKSKGAGEGFRRFRLGSDGERLRVIHVDDMVDLKPFEGVGNRTSILVLQKGGHTRYPVPYTHWTTRPGQRITGDMSLNDIQARTVRRNFQAQPIGGTGLGAWQTGKESVLRSIEAVLGVSSYKARRGAGTDPYGVYWLNVLQRLPDGNMLVENQHEAGKTRIDHVQTSIETELLYPGLRGGGIGRWSYEIAGCIVLSQDPNTRLAFPEAQLKEDLPLTYSYLHRFEAVLQGRRSRFVRRLMERSAFYAMYGIGDYTLSANKVCWQRASSQMKAVAVGLHSGELLQGAKPVIPADTTSFIPVRDPEEAHYLCSLLNSVPVARAIRSYSAPGRGFGAPSVIVRLALPTFDPADRVHARLALLSQQAHAHAAAGDAARVASTEREIDGLAAELWGITDEELEDMRRSLKDLG